MRNHSGMLFSRLAFVGVATLFMLSGMAALMYQVVWSKRLVQVFGASGYAVSLTLSVFMLGLAIGARIGGGIADRLRRPLLIYALIEAGIAFLGWLSDPLLSLCRDWILRIPFAAADSWAFMAVQAMGGFLVLLPPTILMGATLPILVRYCVWQPGRVTLRTGLLYGLNTAGGVLGCFLAGFWLIGRAGFYGALMTAVALNGAVALASLVVSLVCLRRPRAAEGLVKAMAVAEEGRVKKISRLVLAAMFCAGFAALAAECVWTRILLFHLNSTAQTFSAVVGVYLSCSMLGTLMASRRADRCLRPLPRYGLLLLLAAVSILAGFAVWSYFAAGKRYATLAFQLYSGLPVEWQLPVADFLLRIVPPTIVLLALPAFVQGYAFPFAAGYFTDRKATAGRRLGSALMFNTLGCVAGPLVCGFVLLPFLGLQRSLLVCVAVLGLAGCLVRVAEQSMPRWKGVMVTAALVGLIFLLPERVFSSLFSDRAVYFDEAVLEQQGVVIGHEGSNRIIFLEEDVNGSVLVMEQAVPDVGLKLRRLYVGPTSMITDNFAAQRYTKLIGHLPVLLAEQPRRALVICLGTGMTLFGVAAYDSVEQIDCAELSPAVTRAVHCYDHVNGHVMDDPRLNLVINDGRTHLMLSREAYDVIALEPPPPANEGAANLYSREFYELCYEKINTGGVVAQWLPFHLLTEQQVRSLTATMLEVFPTVLLWEIYPGTEFCLTGIKGSEPISYARIAERMSNSNVREMLAPIGIRGVGDLMNCFVAGTDGVRELAAGTEIITDNRPVVGYNLNNLGLLTEYDPQGLAMQNSLIAFEHGNPLAEIFDFQDDETLASFVEAYVKVRGAYLMDRKLAMIASLGMDAFLDNYDEHQVLMPPTELDPDNTLYRARPRLKTYIQAFNRMIARGKAAEEDARTTSCRTAVEKLKKLLPETYYSGTYYHRTVEKDS